MVTSVEFHPDFAALTMESKICFPIQITAIGAKPLMIVVNITKISNNGVACQTVRKANGNVLRKMSSPCLI
jgi:hypothetical protein